MKSIHFAVGGALALFALDAAASCGSAFCLVNTDWSAQGAWLEPGVRFDLRYETIDLDQPRSGRDRVSVGQIPRHHDEVETKNQNWVAGVDWNLSPAWGLSLTLPYVDRDHLHIHNHQGEQLPETWHFRELGDARVQARYEFFAARDNPESQRSAGVTFGLKLPTGKHDVTNDEGELAERTLQPGTGTTDFLVGAYFHGAAPLADTSWFARVQGVLPMNERAGFKPGKQLLIDGGLRYGVARDVGLMLQLNYLAKGRDSGDEAEPEDSGQRMLYLSPGVSWNFTRNAQLYAFAQFPLYQSVNGVQLTAAWSALAGVSWRF
jgi:hypothetical protein